MSKQQSALVVTVKQPLLDWVRRRGINRPYLPQEDCVWLIPSRSTLSATIGYVAYVERMKERILEAELERFGGPNLQGQILQDYSFDELIHLSVRDHVEIGPEEL
jgi:hypothetical protein